MNARAEAVARLGGRYDARVLEPSPPAVSEPPWFADDPVGRDDPPSGMPRVSPVSGAELRWADMLAQDAELAAWCGERWLAAYPALEAIPAKLIATRLALHRLAERVISPARERASGKIGLRFTRGGFGTPFFARDVQLRVVGDRLIVQTGERERSARITTLAAMAAHVGAELLPGAPDSEPGGAPDPEPGGASDSPGTAPDSEPGAAPDSPGGAPDPEPLDVDPEASAFLGDWFGFAASVLEQLRATVADQLEPSRVQLWPEHFDLAVELGSERVGARAGYGASPGDELHAEPYLYVTPWSEVSRGELWQASAFRGAELPYAALLDATGPGGESQRKAALEFFAERLAALSGAVRGSVGPAAS